MAPARNGVGVFCVKIDGNTLIIPRALAYVKKILYLCAVNEMFN